MTYDEYMNAVRKWNALRMRMIVRCVAHKAQKAAQRYRNAIALTDGLWINGEIKAI